MKNYFNRIFRYTLPYKRFFLLNIFTNIFYAFFGTLSMISLFPMLKVLFNQTESLTTEPIWAGIGDIGNYAEAYLNYFVTRTYDNDWRKYLNPKASRDIVFNHLYLDFDEPLTIVEGVFDAIKAGENSVPLLGSTIT